ncbi:hypothetical protein PR370_15845 [Mycobacterium marinum]|uniref:hypothetical protein n=1 Tax=Mycobacterium marinum TaxID=1781 RepID=UPI00235A1157|nr:hypothetical protein [Mycobacterium marinum]MDC8982547.1 hypothetical protein [Mycobacterium marinum]MDC8999061.1 hypothetical protein [Mycobacterium marinum]MDC9011517.1 hypothetical protein [Mycobacterium marinum]
MLEQHVFATLDALRSDREAAAAEVEKLRQQLGEAESQLTKFDDAVRSLEALVNPADATVEPNISLGVRRDSATTPPVDAIDAGSRQEDVPERLAPYLPAGGQRLRSKLMVFDLLQRVDGPVTRRQLQQKFFEYYGRDDLEKYWARPDNALNTAIERASAEKLILEVPGEDGRPTTYVAGFEERQTGRPAMYSGEDD